LKTIDSKSEWVVRLTVKKVIGVNVLMERVIGPWRKTLKLKNTSPIYSHFHVKKK